MQIIRADFCGLISAIMPSGRYYRDSMEPVFVFRPYRMEVNSKVADTREVRTSTNHKSKRGSRVNYQLEPVTDLHRNDNEQANPLMTVREAAQLLRVHERTVTRMCVDGQLRAIRVRGVWRINRAALLEFAGVA